MAEFETNEEWEFVKNHLITDSGATYWFGVYDYVTRSSSSSVNEDWLQEDNIDLQLWFNHYQSSMNNRE